MTTRRLAAVVAGLTVTVALAGLVARCSGSSGFPGVLDKTTPRADVPLSADQVQRATDDLISDRARLTSQTQGDAATTGSTVQASAKKNRPAAAGQPMSLDAAQASAGTNAKP